MQAKFYKIALTLDQKHSILMDNPVKLCHIFFGGFIVALVCVALWRGHMRCRMLTSFLLTACHNLSYRHAEMHEQLLRELSVKEISEYMSSIDNMRQGKDCQLISVHPLPADRFLTHRLLL